MEINMANSIRAERNRTIVLSTQEKDLYSSRLLRLDKAESVDTIKNTTINQDIF